MRQAYSLCYRCGEHPAGTIVYDPAFGDYGCANDDSRTTGVEHISVTLDPDGNYPFFTIPLHHLKRAEQRASAPPNPQQPERPTMPLTPENLSAQIEAAALKGKKEGFAHFMNDPLVMLVLSKIQQTQQIQQGSADALQALLRKAYEDGYTHGTNISMASLMQTVISSTMQDLKGDLGGFGGN